MKTFKKNIALIILITFIGLSSCRKGYKCDCNDNGIGYVDLPDFNKSDAKHYCEELSIASKESGGSGCKLSKM
ncbi:MAG: hypothetical protein H0X62_14330 [Bacteroidetes bacterium]|nr:hypothetical protein [Bacteroidota bacterium]